MEKQFSPATQSPNQRIQLPNIRRHIIIGVVATVALPIAGGTMCYADALSWPASMFFAI
jgi:hypothetical protein